MNIRKRFGFTHALSFSVSWFLRYMQPNWKSRALNMPVYDLPREGVALNLELPTILSANVLDISDQKGSYASDVQIDAESPYVWFVPAWSNVWGGGHFTIFRFAHLMSKSRRNVLYIYDNNGRFDDKYFIASLNQAFPGNKLEVWVDPKQIQSSIIPIATTWQSVYSLLNYSSSKLPKFYFMQDYESWFYAHGTESMQAQASYEQGLIGITGGPWLLSKFQEHGGEGLNYMFTVDHDIFYPLESHPKSVRRIFFYGRPSTERRCFELGIAALKIVKERNPEIEIVFAGLGGISNVGFEATFMGNVPLPELGDLYRSCDLGLALSGTNLSYLPVELMACGIPVVTNSGPHVEWYCKNEENSLVAAPFPSSIASAITRLIEDSDLRAHLRHMGLEKSKMTNWVTESENIQKFIEKNISEND